MIIFLLLAVCVASALAAFFAPREARLFGSALAFSSVIGLLGAWGSLSVLFSHTQTIWHGWGYVDQFAALLLLIISFVQWTATLVSLPYMREELHEKVIEFKQARWYFSLLPLFVLSMVLTVTSNNLGIMWVALEGTTLATTILVAFYTKGGSLEAAWKYIVLCSVGITLGLLGILLVFHAAILSGQFSAADGVTWTALRHLAANLDPVIMRWAFVFIFIGYGAKVGLVPMHTWLPDAHGRTPSPISGMLSGVLLNVALFAILRFKFLVDPSQISSAWTNKFFLVFGALSFALPAAFIVMQKNYKRLLAYSSIEHMGLIVFSIGLGALGMMAAMINLIGHALAKSLLFFGTGNLLLHFKSTKFERVSDVLHRLPLTGGFFLFGLLALLAVPPSPLFLGEYLAFVQGFAVYPWLTIGLLLAGAVIFAGMIQRIMPMLCLSPDATNTPSATRAERWNLSHTAMALHACALLVVGIALFFPATQTWLERLTSSLL